ncbi:hypothetical protein CK228_15175 [Mesorhizobium sp. WSM4312]|uniref:hypothetical protein n=1 Tax=unclassified Mesorhizobium TaxID=325217 RepID=UPI000BB02106|nr:MULTISPECIES: hypothetical protein [unclassified Mesorhizobium]PBB67784.1 hypothetical protein CK228_15175 [Mesorhizobium sp. WSM4312]PBC23377.1 hypothetical protein CK226_09550 [Mesorhizobium sp. WSM4311]TRC88959.1 hypothetical protein FJV80_11850 [Mesorhizobium sp. WSM4310]TRD06743.1 hypothetical protein FJV82_08360 [Mesorhizobium sp. WSM4305]
MTGNAYQQSTDRFAHLLMRQAAWPAALVLAANMLAPLAARARGAFETLPAAVALSLAAVSAVAVLALSALLAFDALLFRLMASHDDEASAGAAVDDMLARMRLKPLPPSARSLDERMAGTRRLLTRQRIALGLFVAMLLAAGFWAPR